MSDAPSVTGRSRRKIGVTDSTPAAAATSSPTIGRPSLAEFASSAALCKICVHPHRNVIEEGLAEKFSPGTIARYLRIHYGEPVTADTLRKQIVRHVEAGHVTS